MVDYDPFSAEVYDDPFPVYRRLRDEAPVHYLEEFDCWFLSRFEDIWQTMSDQRALTSSRGTTSTHLLTRQTPTGHNISMLDGEAHTRVRAYLNKFFLPGHLRALEPQVRELARSAVDDALEKGSFDALAMGGYVSVRVASLLLGLPLEDADQVMEWVNTYFDREPGHRGSTKHGVYAAKELAIHLLKLTAEARVSSAPDATVLRKLLTTELDGTLLDDMAIVQHLNMLVIGGTETFPKVFSAALLRLFEHPDQRRACVEHPALIPDAFQETLRYDMPTQMLGRTVAEDLEIGGKSLRKGSGLMFLYACANRDEREFDDPDRFDIARRAPRILSFGHGQHQCLGAHVARLEARVLLEEVLRRMPDYEVDMGGALRLRSEFFRGFAALPIRCRSN
jgi:hypothetical protein